MCGASASQSMLPPSATHSASRSGFSFGSKLIHGLDDVNQGAPDHHARGIGCRPERARDLGVRVIELESHDQHLALLFGEFPQSGLVTLERLATDGLLHK